MWYLQNRGEKRGNMRIQETWDLGYTGKGIVVSILDDGLERDHPDIIDRFNWLASFDINDEDNDPMPNYTKDNNNKHGTRCAGIVAAAANNSECIVGIAYDSSIGGVRMLDGDVNDSVEAAALSYNTNLVHIYSEFLAESWFYALRFSQPKSFCQNSFSRILPHGAPTTMGKP